MRFDATRLTRLGRVGAVALAPDGTWLAVQVARLDADEKAYVSDLWRVPLGGGAPERLTHGEHNDVAPRFDADGRLCFLSDRPHPADPDKGKRRQVWRMPAGVGEPTPLTDEPLGVSDYRLPRAPAAGAPALLVMADVLPGVPHAEQRAHAVKVAERGPSGLHYKEMPIRFWDHWIGVAAPHAIAYDAAGARRDLTPDADRAYRPTELDYGWDVAPDGGRVALSAQAAGADRVHDVWLDVIDTRTGARTELGREVGSMVVNVRFSPDGAQLAMTRLLRTAGCCGRVTLRLFDAATGPTGRGVADAWDAWPVLEAWTPDGRALLCTADDDGTVPIFTVDVASGEVARITAASAGGCHGGLSIAEAGPARGAVIGVRHALLHPPEPFRVALAPGAAPELLASLSGWTPEDGATVATIETFAVAGDGGTPVHSFLVRPTGGPAPLPVLLWIHGGPVGQTQDGWHWRWNPLVPAAAGYAVLLPNPRGSTGRGQDFIEGVWNNQWGGACYRDLMAVCDHVPRLPGLDATRVAAMGGSFGGYMANWIGGQTDRFRCIVTHASIYHFTAFHGATDYPAYFALELGGTPYAGDPEAWDRYSPHRHAQKWKTPALVIHGEKDYRVPISEGLLLFEALQMHGVDSELLVFPDENHWILRPQNSRLWYETIHAFLARHMMKA
ncbi:MAG TPA: S9 family peptidase [Kofleriaceae bacterium]|nr:S9 family peptidase [Kofleriaceae bacterium]